MAANVRLENHRYLKEICCQFVHSETLGRKFNLIHNFNYFEDNDYNRSVILRLNFI